jgi:branched-chain amino acid transport system substrate-binding protein
VEQVRKLIESDEVFLVFNALGTPTQTGVQKYHNAKKVPQLFLATGASKWNDPKEFPWTMGFQPSYRVEARIFAKYILKNKPDAKVAVLRQRRLRQGLRRRPEGSVRRQDRQHSDRRGKL